MNKSHDNTDSALMTESLVREIESALATLTELERDIVKLFFELGVQEMTLEEIGDKFGMTPERVRQIKINAISRLRHQGITSNKKI